MVSDLHTPPSSHAALAWCRSPLILEYFRKVLGIRDEELAALRRSRRQEEKRLQAEKDRAEVIIKRRGGGSDRKNNVEVATSERTRRWTICKQRSWLCVDVMMCDLFGCSLKVGRVFARVCVSVFLFKCVCVCIRKERLSRIDLRGRQRVLYSKNIPPRPLSLVILPRYILS